MLQRVEILWIRYFVYLEGRNLIRQSIDNGDAVCVDIARAAQPPVVVSHLSRSICQRPIEAAAVTPIETQNRLT